MLYYLLYSIHALLSTLLYSCSTIYSTLSCSTIYSTLFMLYSTLLYSCFYYLLYSIHALLSTLLYSCYYSIMLLYSTLFMLYYLLYSIHALLSTLLYSCFTIYTTLFMLYYLLYSIHALLSKVCAHLQTIADAYVKKSSKLLSICHLPSCSFLGPQPLLLRVLCV